MVTAQKVNNRLPKNTTAKDPKALTDAKATGGATEGKSVGTTKADKSAKPEAAKTETKTETKAKSTKKAPKSKGKGKGKTKSPVEQLMAQNATLKDTLSQIEKQFGDGSIMPLGSRPDMVVEAISTGSLSLDIALGGRGIPKGRIAEIYGPESSGKTTLALHAVAEAQKSGGIAAFIDAEHALDPSWAKKLGVRLETLLVSQPSSGEEAM